MLIYLIAFPGILERLRDGSDISDINIPVWDVSYKDFQKVINYMQSDAENITVVIEIGFDGTVQQNLNANLTNPIFVNEI